MTGLRNSISIFCLRGLETKSSAIWSWDQDISHLLSRSRPWSPGLETKTLAFRSSVN